MTQSEATRRNWPIEVSCLPSIPSWGDAFQHGLLLFSPFLSLFNELPRDDAKHFIDAFPVLGADFVAAVPANILAPEAAASLAIHTRHATGTTSADGR